MCARRVFLWSKKRNLDSEAEVEELGQDKAECELNDTEHELCKHEAGCELEECTDQRLGDA